MAEPIASFADYIARQQSGSIGAPAASTFDPSKVTPVVSKKNKKPQSPVNWLFDILSRPLMGATNVVASAVDRGAEAAEKARSGDTGGAIGKAAHGLAAMPLDFLTGMFSTDEKHKKFSGQTMEHIADTFGPLRDPNYVDEENNVNPWVKGIGGFALDVALDPLTYVPGGLIAKGLKGVGGLAKSGGKAAVAGGKAAKEVLVPGAKKTVDEVPAPGGIDTPVSIEDVAEQMEKGKTKLPPAMPPTIAEQLSTAPQARSVGKFLDDLEADVARAKKSAGKVIPDAKPLGRKEWAADLAKKAPEFKIGVLKVPGLADEAMTASSAANKLRQTKDPAVRAQLTQMMSRHYTDYLEDFAEGMSQGVRRDVLGQELPAVPSSVVKAINTYEAFAARHTENVEAVVDGLGTQLTSYLKSKQKPETFARAVDSLRRALAGESNLEKIVLQKNQEHAAVSALLRSVGIDAKGTMAAREAATRLSAMEEMVAKMRGGSDPEKLEWAQNLSEALQQEVSNLAERMPHVTDTGVLRTHPKAGHGTGRHSRELNTFSSLTFWSKIASPIFKRIGKELRDPDTGKALLGGERRAMVARSEIMPALRSTEALLIERGIPVKMGIGEESKILLTTSELIDVLSSLNMGAVNRALFNLDTSVPLTNLHMAVVEALTGGDAAAVRKILLNDKKWGNKGTLLNEDLSNPMREGGRYNHTDSLGKKVPPKDPPPGISYEPSGSGWYHVYDGEHMATELTETILAAAPELAERTAKNRAYWTSRSINEAGELSAESHRAIAELLEDPTAVAEALERLANIPGDIRANAMAMGATEDAMTIATVTSVAGADDAVLATAKAGVSMEKGATNAAKDPANKTTTDVLEATQEANQKAGQQQSRANDYDVDEAFRGAAPGAEDEVLELSSMYTKVMATASGILHPLKKAFVQDYGAKRLYNPMHSMNNRTATLSEGYHRELASIGARYNKNLDGTETNILNRAMQVLQGKIVDETPQIAEAVAALRSAVAKIFDTGSQGSLLNSPIFRSNVGIQQLNDAILRRFNGGERYLYNLTDIRRGDEALHQKLLDQWKSWDIDDPLDFLSRMQTASQEIATTSAVARNFVTTAEKWGAVSATPKEGFVRLSDAGGSVFGPYLPKNVYFEKSLADEIHTLDVLKRTSRHPQGELGHFLRTYYSPVQNAWKQAVTIYRAGHHARNAVSDAGLTFTAEGARYYIAAMKDSYKLLSMRNTYTGVDMVAALAEFGIYNLPSTGAVMSKGKLGTITYDGMLRATDEAGLWVTARIAEDLLTDSVLEGAMARGMRKLVLDGTVVSDGAKSMSQFTSHLGRIQHFSQIIRKVQKTGKDHEGNPIKSIQELMEYASIRVKKFHPDGNMLTPGFEARWARHIIPFYTWFGKIMPAILETYALNPGRAMVFPKASFGLATAMGVSPDSLANPFPTDQLFPSFLTEQALGPQFGNARDGYFGINPGFAHLDILNTIGAHPIRGTAGMVSPLIRTGPELLSEASWATGAKINDKSDYLDSSIPVVNYLANLSGMSVTGSLVSMLQGKGMDPQYQVARGNKTGTDKAHTAFNWLTGMGALNMSRPNFIRYAEIEKRNLEGDKQSGF